MMKSFLIIFFNTQFLFLCVAFENSEAAWQETNVERHFKAKPTEAELLTADYGKPQTKEQVAALLEIFTASIKSKLKDPASAQIRFLKKTNNKSWLFKWTLGKPGYKKLFGYSLCLAVNAKNSYGGYVGEVRYVALVKDGKFLGRGDDLSSSKGGSRLGPC